MKFSYFPKKSAAASFLETKQWIKAAYLRNTTDGRMSQFANKRMLFCPTLFAVFLILHHTYWAGRSFTPMICILTLRSLDPAWNSGTLRLSRNSHVLSTFGTSFSYTKYKGWESFSVGTYLRHLCRRKFGSTRSHCFSCKLLIEYVGTYTALNHQYEILHAHSNYFALQTTRCTEVSTTELSVDAPTLIQKLLV